MSYCIGVTRAVFRGAARLLPAACLVFFGMATGSNAEWLDHGDFDGARVKFRDVKEFSATDNVPLFGQPVVADDSLLFHPVGFSASSINPAGETDITDGELFTTIELTSGTGIGIISIREAGDYTIIGPPGALAFAQVSTPVFYQVEAVDGRDVAGPSGTAQVLFTPSGGDYDLATDGIGVGVIWQGELDIDVESLLAAQHLSGMATRVSFHLDNALATTQNGGGGAALIAKKMFAVSVTQSVPEPSTLTLAAIGLLGLLGLVRGRAAAAAESHGH